jgi:Family of unknown function (DUF6055)
MTRALLPKRWPAVAAGALLATVLATASADAAPNSRAHARSLSADRPAAQKALDRARAVAHGARGHRGRELSGALLSLAQRLDALPSDERKAAEDLLARPTDPNHTNQPGGPYTVPAVAAYTTHFCFHWVESTADAPPLADDNHNNFPDYVDEVADTFEHVYDVENDAMGWRAPKSDGTLGGCTNGGAGLTDVYLKDIGKLGLYGYASIDPGQPQGDVSRYAFQVMDNDYSKAEFPQYNGYLPPLEVTAAHEYNHVLQDGYDFVEDKWMFEATATWMEDEVYPDINDYHQYMAPWAQRSLEPITAPDDAKVYGSAVWNHWLSDRYGAAVVRHAWEVSGDEGDFAPGAYDRAIKDAGGHGFEPELIDFAASTAEWGAANSGIHEGSQFPAMQRVTNGGQPITLPTDGTTIQGSIDHTGYALFDVAHSDAVALDLYGALPDGTAGGIALVGFAGGQMTKVLGLMPNGGQTKVTLPNPGRFSRITAVVVNADPSINDWGGQDWNWTRDGQHMALAVKAVAGDNGNPGNPGNPANPGNPGGPIGPIVPPPDDHLTRAPVVQLASGGTLRVAKGAFPITAHVDRAGRLTAKASVNAATARKLGLGRRAVTIGTGTASAGGAGKVVVKIRLTAKAKAHLKRRHGAVKVALKLTFAPASGSPVTVSAAKTLR